jgi:hypothetical protein
MPTYRIDADSSTGVEIVASRIAPSRDEIRFERRVDGQWSIEAAYRRGTIRRILQQFVESDGSVRWVSVGRGILTDAPGQS